MNSLIFMLPTEPIPIPSTSVGREDGGAGGEGIAPAVLDVPIEFDDFCARCGKWQRFIAEFQVGNGLFGCCPFCGEERVVRFTRMVA